MSKEKQVSDMAKIISQYEDCGDCGACKFHGCCSSELHAENLYDAGYCSQSEVGELRELLDATIAGQETLQKALVRAKVEVAREIFEEIEKHKSVPFGSKCECIPFYIVSELKKKYTEDSNGCV